MMIDHEDDIPIGIATLILGLLLSVGVIVGYAAYFLRWDLVILRWALACAGTGLLVLFFGAGIFFLYFLDKLPELPDPPPLAFVIIMNRPYHFMYIVFSGLLFLLAVFCHSTRIQIVSAPLFIASAALSFTRKRKPEVIESPPPIAPRYVPPTPPVATPAPPPATSYAKPWEASARVVDVATPPPPKPPKPNPGSLYVGDDDE